MRTSPGADGPGARSADAPRTMAAGMPSLAEGVVTVGVAVSVPEPYADELATWRERFGDPLARAIPAHVTLLPPTQMPPGHLATVVRHLEGAARVTEPFTMRLRGTGTFRPVSPVVFVQVAEGIASCELLEEAVRCGPLQRDVAFAYHPHVTVAHDVEEAALDRAFATLADYEVAFPVDAFWLYLHGSDGVWRPERRFPLGDPLDGR